MSISSIDVRASKDQHSNEFIITVSHSRMQSRAFLTVMIVDIRAGIEKNLDYAKMAMSDGYTERMLSTVVATIPAVRICTFIQKMCDPMQLPCFNCLKEFVVQVCLGIWWGLGL
jgi:hypothetical protein